MIHLNPHFYDDLAQEIVTAISDNGQTEGVIELKVEIDKLRTAEVLFAFNSAQFTLDAGLMSINYILIAFENGVRVSADFDAEKLLSILEI